MPRTRKSVEVRRDEILDEAIRLIGERGYYGFTIPELARRCALTNGGLLYHFGSKETLFLEVLRERDLRETASVRAALESRTRELAGQGASLDAAVKVLRAILMSDISKPELMRLDCVLQAESLDPAHPVHEYFREREEMVLELFRSILAPYVTEPLALARQVYALTEGIELQWLRSGESFDLLEEWDRAIAKLLPVEPKRGE